MDKPPRNPPEDTFAWLRDLGFDDAEIAAMRADALTRIALGEFPDVRQVVEDGDTDVDIAASRRRDREK